MGAVAALAVAAALAAAGWTQAPPRFWIAGGAAALAAIWLGGEFRRMVLAPPRPGVFRGAGLTLLGLAGQCLTAGFAYAIGMGLHELFE